MTEHLTLHEQDGLAVVKMNRPPVNAQNAGLVEELADTFQRLEKDESVRSVILGSTNPRFFSAGLDLPELATYDEFTGAAFIAAYLNLFEQLYRFPKPLVAAIPGHCVAGGAVFAVTADYRVAAEGDYQISMHEVDVGLPIPEPQARVVHHLIGAGLARDLFLRGHRYGPEEAWEIGLVDEVVPAGDVDATAEALARELGGKPPLAFRQIKAAHRQEVWDVMERLRDENVDAVLRHVAHPETRKEMGRAAERLGGGRKDREA